MNLSAEIGQQIHYQRKLARILGWKDALRMRGFSIAGKLALHQSKTIRLHPAHLAHPIELRPDSSDLDAFAQVVTVQEYSPMIDASARFIVDCGANVGLTAAYFLTRIPDAQVVAIEPFAANAEICRRNLAPYGRRATVIEAAVWSRPTELVIEYDAGNEWGVRVREVRSGEKGTVKAIDLPGLGLPHIDILKIDIEGSEAELFSRDTEGWLPKVSSMAIELHGPECERQFRSAMSQYDYVESQSGELTICKQIKKHG